VIHFAPGGGIPGMECPTAQNLLAAYTAAALEHVEAINNLTDLLELSSKDKLAEAKRQTEQTSAKCRAAHVAARDAPRGTQVLFKRKIKLARLDSVQIHL
jgi:transcription elongation GreA/GreB family factor